MWRFHRVDPVKNFVLDRIGILKFVDQGGRELLANQACQPFGIGPLQRIPQTIEQIIEAHLRALGLLLPEADPNPPGGVAEDVETGRWERL